MSENKVELRRQLRARPERVYAAFSQANQWMRWFGRGETANASLDTQVGGRWWAEMTGPRGEPSRVAGVFHEVSENQRLVFTWQWSAPGSKAQLVTVTITPSAHGTDLTLLHEAFPSAESQQLHREGWLEAIDKITRVVEE